MQILIKWIGLKTPKQGFKVLCMDKIGLGFLKLLKFDNGSYMIEHDVSGGYWVTNTGSLEEMQDIYTETLQEELS